MHVRQRLKRARTIVIKIGTKVLLETDGTLATGIFRELTTSVAKLLRRGHRVLLVSSGAVGIGAARLSLSPTQIALCAAAGQTVLTSTYHGMFAEMGIATAQVLVTDDDFHSPERRERLLQMLNQLATLKVVPIVNENDAITHAAPSGARAFCDNDMLASLIGTAMQADLLVLLTDVDGVYHEDPQIACTLPLAEIKAGAQSFSLSERVDSLGRGGITAKVRAAAHAVQMQRLTAVIANGRTPKVLERILRGDPIGTLITAAEVE